MAYVPYIVATGGAWMVVLAAMVSSKDIPSRVLFKIVPALLGAALMWSSAILFLS